MPPAQEIAQLGIIAVVVLLVVFYGGTLLMTLGIGRKKENADGYMTAGNKIGFGISAASMTATWIWASSMYASATAGYTYGVSGPIHCNPSMRARIATSRFATRSSIARFDSGGKYAAT